MASEFTSLLGDYADNANHAKDYETQSYPIAEEGFECFAYNCSPYHLQSAKWRFMTQDALFFVSERQGLAKKFGSGRVHTTMLKTQVRSGEVLHDSGRYS